MLACVILSTIQRPSGHKRTNNKSTNHNVVALHTFYMLLILTHKTCCTFPTLILQLYVNRSYFPFHAKFNKNIIHVPRHQFKFYNNLWIFYLLWKQFSSNIYNLWEIIFKFVVLSISLARPGIILYVVWKIT